MAYKPSKSRKAHGALVVDSPESQQGEFLRDLENTGEPQKMMGQKCHCIRGRMNGKQRAERLGTGENGR